MNHHSETDLGNPTSTDVGMNDFEVRYRRLFQIVTEGIVILDADTGKVIDANPFLLELLGYTREELLGKELWEIGLFRDADESRAAYRKLHEAGGVRYTHLSLASKNEQKIEIEFVSNAYQENGRRIIECHLRHLSEPDEAEQESDDSGPQEDEFLAMLSHELRSPLAPMLNAVLLLRLHTGQNPELEQSANIIERQVGQLKQIVDDLLEVSRLSTGRLQIRQERVAMAGIVEHALQTVRPLIDQHKHELTLSLPADPIWLFADTTRLEQVVVNLLTNAAKYTPDGGRLWLTVQQEAKECVLRVRDTGVGIAPELLPRIFDLFIEGERSADRSQSGLGIGLALVHRLVEMHGGRVEAYSTVGQGSEFVVHLPVALFPAPASAATEPVKPADSALRVLVVDDNVDTAETLAMLLKTFGHDVRMGHDGPTALETARTFRPHVVLLDLGLPGLNGFEVAKRMRQDPVLRDVMLVALTGYELDTDGERSQSAGFDHHLVKPASFGKVQEILATVVK